MPRAFIALDLPQQARATVTDLQDALREQALFTRTYTKPAHLHLTLKFLGDISNEELAWVRTQLGNVNATPFTATIAEPGTFGRRVVWVRLLGAEALQQAIDKTLQEHYEPEERFHGHVTIARPKDLAKGEPLGPRVRALPAPNHNFTPESYTLYTSKLTPKGPEYTAVQTYALIE